MKRGAGRGGEGAGGGGGGGVGDSEEDEGENRAAAGGELSDSNVSTARGGLAELFMSQRDESRLASKGSVRWEGSVTGGKGSGGRDSVLSSGKGAEAPQSATDAAARVWGGRGGKGGEGSGEESGLQRSCDARSEESWEQNVEWLLEVNVYVCTH